MEMRESLEQEPVEASAPCRIDMGGTLDLSTFHLPIHGLEPCTFNIALDLRTHIRLEPYKQGCIKISSHGFESLEAESGQAPYNSPLGLMFAVADYFQADGVHITIRSTSPPRSALGGSSVAAAALIWAFAKLNTRRGVAMPQRKDVAVLAHAIEQSVAGVPCGMQDQLAAVYGGINAWHWRGAPYDPPFQRQELVPADACDKVSRHLLVAYCGRPHVSKDVNATWVRQFVDGRHRQIWHQIIDCSRRFVAAFAAQDYEDALAAMNQETDLRCRLTPDVLDPVGTQLVAAARKYKCGARFTGAGGGGCLWALGAADPIERLRPEWETLLARHETAKILPAEIDTHGLL